MSGGHFNFAGVTAWNYLQEIGCDPIVRKRWPALAAALEALGEEIKAIEHEIDFDISADRNLGVSDQEYDIASITRLHYATLKLHLVDWQQAP